MYTTLSVRQKNLLRVVVLRFLYIIDIRLLCLNYSIHVNMNMSCYSLEG